MEDFPLADLESKKTFQSALKILDSAFQYDDRVQLPSDFEAYFMKFQRRVGQTLLAYCTEHDELLRRLDRHKVTCRPRCRTGCFFAVLDLAKSSGNL